MKEHHATTSHLATVDLSARELALVEAFVRHPGRVLSRERLLSHVWGYVVDVYVRYLRRNVNDERIVALPVRRSTGRSPSG